MGGDPALPFIHLGPWSPTKILPSGPGPAPSPAPRSSRGLSGSPHPHPREAPRVAGYVNKLWTGADSSQTYSCSHGEAEECGFHGNQQCHVIKCHGTETRLCGRQPRPMVSLDGSGVPLQGLSPPLAPLPSPALQTGSPWPAGPVGCRLELPVLGVGGGELPFVGGCRLSSARNLGTGESSQVTTLPPILMPRLRQRPSLAPGLPSASPHARPPLAALFPSHLRPPAPAVGTARGRGDGVG